MHCSMLFTYLSHGGSGYDIEHVIAPILLQSCILRSYDNILIYKSQNLVGGWWTVGIGPGNVLAPFGQLGITW